MSGTTQAARSKAPRRSVFRSLNRVLARFATRVTSWVGGNWAFSLAVLVVLTWVATGPLFRYSDTWQLVINTGTTIVTFLMVFLIQRAQNKESRAIQLKLNELVAALQGASNHLIGVEQLSEEDLEVLGRHYQVLIERTRNEGDITQSHSVEEAERRHDDKLDARKASKQRTRSA